MANKWEIAGGGERPLFLMVLSSAHIEKTARERDPEEERAAYIHRSLMQRLIRRANSNKKKEDK